MNEYLYSIEWNELNNCYDVIDDSTNEVVRTFDDYLDAECFVCELDKED